MTSKKSGETPFKKSKGMVGTSLGKRLLKVTLGIYFIFALASTSVQVYMDYQHEKEGIALSLKEAETIYQKILSDTIWNLRFASLDNVLFGMLQNDSIIGIQIKDASDIKIKDLGFVKNEAGNITYVATHKLQQKEALVSPTSLLEHRFFLEVENEKIATVYLYSSREVAFNRIKYTIVLTILTAILKTLFLSLAFLFTVTYLVSKPLTVLDDYLRNTHSKMSVVDVEQLHKTAIWNRNDELGTVTHSIAAMQTSILEKNIKLDTYNSTLEEEIKKRRAELENAHELLLEQAHQSGKAEMASGVLHNIGNVLTSVAVASEFITERLHTSSMHKTKKISEILQLHRNDMEQFLHNDATGARTLEYLMLLGEHQQDEVSTLEDLQYKINTGLALIKESVEAQQDLATNGNFSQTIELDELILSLLKLRATTFEKYSITIRTQFDDVSSIEGVKSTIGNVIDNLIKNAQDSLCASDGCEKHIAISLEEKEDAILLNVSDNGTGISETCLNKIFTYGFTTKDSGKGFGLHYCSNAMKSMGGDLRAHSEGEGRGATFTLVYKKK